MKAKCYKCNWEWNYKGKSTKYLTCPKCLYKLNVQKALGKLPNIKEKTPTYLPNIPKKTPYKKTIEVPKTESVGKLDEDLNEEKSYEELFPEKIIKLCDEHNLPAKYNDYDKKWKCKKCIESEIIINRPYKKI